MARAVELALKGRPATAPNPCVGAVLARGSDILAEGYHRRYGGPHAEVECLRQASERGADTEDATLYVTLEPCNHHGKTPPCTEAILAARIPEVMVGATDPNPDVAGGGVERLRDAGVRVTTGVLEPACLELIEDFMVWKTTDLPFTTLKLAATLDGRIAPRGGRRQAISCAESWADVQQYRAWAQAVLVGGNTLSLDNPSLTRRDVHGDETDDQPLAVVVTSSLPDPDADLALIARRPEQTVLLTTPEAEKSLRADELRAKGVRVWALPTHSTPGQPTGRDLRQGLVRLRAELNVHRILCEGGGQLASSLLEQGLTHEFVLYLAPRALADNTATPLLTGRSVADMAEALHFRIAHHHALGRDLKLVLKPE